MAGDWWWDLPVAAERRRGGRGTTRTTRSPSTRSSAAAPSRARCAPWSRRSTATRCRAASGTARTARARRCASACIATRAGATGSDRTREPVPAWSTSACSVSRIVPNSTRADVVHRRARPVARRAGTRRRDRWRARTGTGCRRAPSTNTGAPSATNSNRIAMTPSRPWPRTVRGRTIVTSSPAATASWHSSSARSLARPYASSGRRRRVLGHRVVLGDAEHRARRRVHDLARRPRRAPRPARSRCRPTFTVEQRAILGQRHLGDVVEHDVDAVARARAPRRGRARRPRRTRPPRARPGGFRSKMRTVVAAGERLLGQHRAEVAAAAGDEERARPSERVARARGTSARSPACRRAARPAGRSRAPCGPGRCRTRSCPSARRARAAPARSGPRPAASAVELLRDHARDARDRAAGRRDTGEPFGRERVAHRREHVAQRVRLGVGDPVRAARTRAGDASASSTPCTRLLGVHHRPALRARRRRAGSGPAGPRAKNCVCRVGLERTVEPRRPHDHGREVAAVVARAARAARPRASSAPYPMYGLNGESSSKRSVGRRVRAERRVRRDVHEARRARAPGPVEHELGAADVHVEELARRPRGWITAAAWKTVTLADAVEEPVERRPGRARRRRRPRPAG